jgi:radical SAM-linked protein
MIRTRIYYKKINDLIYTGSLDIQKIWERSFRRAGISIVYSEGFHPQARIQQASPLPLGFWGENEIVDIWLDSFISEETLNILKKRVPNGIEIINIEEIDLRAPALQSIVNAADYLIIFPVGKEIVNLVEKINRTIRQSELMITKKGKTINLVKLIESLTVFKNEDKKSIEIHMRLKLLPGATGRPEDVLRAININTSDVRIIRKNLIFSSTGI